LGRADWHDTARRYNPQHRHLGTHRRQNFKSYLLFHPQNIGLMFPLL
jgi:hypothetical protein